MTREEILDYLSSKGIDLQQGPDPQDFSLEGSIILCGIRAYLSVDMTRKYFRTDPIIGTPLSELSRHVRIQLSCMAAQDRRRQSKDAHTEA